MLPINALSVLQLKDDWLVAVASENVVRVYSLAHGGNGGQYSMTLLHSLEDQKHIAKVTDVHFVAEDGTVLIANERKFWLQAGYVPQWFHSVLATVYKYNGGTVVMCGHQIKCHELLHLKSPVNAVTVVGTQLIVGTAGTDSVQVFDVLHEWEVVTRPVAQVKLSGSITGFSSSGNKILVTTHPRTVPHLLNKYGFWRTTIGQQVARLMHGLDIHVSQGSAVYELFRSGAEWQSSPVYHDIQVKQGGQSAVSVNDKILVAAESGVLMCGGAIAASTD